MGPQKYFYFLWIIVVWKAKEELFRFCFGISLVLGEFQLLVRN